MGGIVKRADISDNLIGDLAAQMSGVYAELIRRGYPPKVVEVALERAIRHGVIQQGPSLSYVWREES
jgi:hypothetical protein